MALKHTFDKKFGQVDKFVTSIPDSQLPEKVFQDTIQKTTGDFIRITAEKFKKSIWRLDARSSGDLYESLRSRTSVAGAKVTGTVSFNYYGRFVDLGVGRGLKAIERKTGRSLTNNRNSSRITRIPKPWLSEVFPAERHRFGEILARDVAKAQAENLAGILPSGTLPVQI